MLNILDRGALHEQYRIINSRRGWYGKGVGAEAGAVAGILAGSTENIRPAVAFCEELSKQRSIVARAFFGIALRLSFLFVNKYFI